MGQSPSSTRSIPRTLTHSAECTFHVERYAAAQKNKIRPASRSTSVIQHACLQAEQSRSEGRFILYLCLRRTRSDFSMSRQCCLEQLDCSVHGPRGLGRQCSSAPSTAASEHRGLLRVSSPFRRANMMHLLQWQSAQTSGYEERLNAHQVICSTVFWKSQYIIKSIKYFEYQ